MKRYFLSIALAINTAVCCMGNGTMVLFVDGEKFSEIGKKLQDKNPTFYNQLKWDNPEGIQFDCMANIYLVQNLVWQQINKELGDEKK